MPAWSQIRVLKDPWSATTHFAGFLAALVGAFMLVYRVGPDPARVAGVSAYGLGLVGLFLASSVYHFVDLGERLNHYLQRVDHAAIYLFIAACYAPPALFLMEDAQAAALLGLVGALGVGGAIFKLVWFRAPVWLSVGGYLALGWMGLAIVPFAAETLAPVRVAQYLLGGLCYTLGTVVFIRQRPDPWPQVFGHHEIWHLFVLAGAILHYSFVYHLITLERMA